MNDHQPNLKRVIIEGGENTPKTTETKIVIEVLKQLSEWERKYPKLDSESLRIRVTSILRQTPEIYSGVTYRFHERTLLGDDNLYLYLTIDYTEFKGKAGYGKIDLDCKYELCVATITSENQ